MDKEMWTAAGVVTAAFLGFAGTLLARWWEQAQANRRPFLERQFALCFEAAEAASKLATTTDEGEWETARATFWRLYWGPLCIVEDPDVEEAMYELGKRIPRPGIPRPALPMTGLSRRSLVLAHQIRKLVLKSWKVKLPDLDFPATTTKDEEPSGVASPD